MVRKTSWFATSVKIAVFYLRHNINVSFYILKSMLSYERLKIRKLLDRRIKFDRQKSSVKNTDDVRIFLNGALIFGTCDYYDRSK